MIELRWRLATEAEREQAALGKAAVPVFQSGRSEGYPGVLQYRTWRVAILANHDYPLVLDAKGAEKAIEWTEWTDVPGPT